jgi:triosephosphate isomerase
MDVSNPPLTCTSTKMNLGRDQTLAWLEQVILPHSRALSHLSFFACLPYPLIPEAISRLAGTGITVGSQNCWPSAGAVTGEVSAGLLAELGCRHVMLGHAERRRLFDEDDALIGRKAAAAVEAGMTPLICVGETDPISAPAAAASTTDQTCAALAGIPLHKAVTILYEPVWAIGKAHGAHPDHAATVLQTLRTALNRPRARFLYGGAVTPGTYTALRAAAPWDGVALGRAAQDAGMLHEVTAELLTFSSTA